MKAILFAATGFVLLWLLKDQSGAIFGSGGGATVNGNGTAGTVEGKLTYQQLQQLWIQNGGNPASASLAAAVAMAESGGDPNAFNPNDPNGGSVGLWQINGIHGAQASADPNVNAAAAVNISGDGTNWQPWGAYTNGSYAQFYDAPAGES